MGSSIIILVLSFIIALGGSFDFFFSYISFTYFKGKGIYTDNEVSYHLKLANDLAEYTADVGATITHDKQKTIYKPYLKLHLPGDNRDSTSLDKMRVNRRQAPQMVTVNGELNLQK